VTGDRRLRIGGWAALLVAILAPIEVAVLFASAGLADPYASPAVVTVEIARLTALLAAVFGLDRLFRSLAPGAAPTLRVAGVVAATGVIVVDAVELAGFDTGVVGVLVTLAASALIGAWYIGGGAVLMREGGGLARIGWSAELGGLGVILSAITIAIGLAGPVGAGMTWTEWFTVLSLFVVVYLVRVWRYVVGGRLPGPGIL
jgi:hypothetical protein